MPTKEQEEQPLQDCVLCDTSLPGVLALKTKDICIRCKKPFCTLHTSTFSPRYCNYCLSDITLLQDKFEKVTEHHVRLKDGREELLRVKHSCRHLRLDGPDYVWYVAKVQSVTDDELTLLLEFHRSIVSQLETDSDTRKIRAFQAVYQNPDGRTVVSTRTTQTKKTTETKVTRTPKVKAAPTLEETLRKNNPTLSEKQIQQMLKIMQGA